jgi:hypothetical protein
MNYKYYILNKFVYRIKYKVEWKILHGFYKTKWKKSYQFTLQNNKMITTQTHVLAKGTPIKRGEIRKYVLLAEL